MQLTTEYLASTIYSNTHSPKVTHVIAIFHSFPTFKSDTPFLLPKVEALVLEVRLGEAQAHAVTTELMRLEHVLGARWAE